MNTNDDINARVDKLISRLDDIARKNDGRFVYRIDLARPDRGSSDRYAFVAEEKVSLNLFVLGRGLNIEEALIAAENKIEEALEVWGYKE